MAIRYFNLKKGSEKVNGGLIRVNTSESDLEKLADFNGDFAFSPWEFEYLGEEGEDRIYEIHIPNEKAVASPEVDALGGPTSIVGPVSDGPTDILKVKLGKEGELGFYDPNQKGFYLSEVSEEAAKRNRSDAGNWALQRAYIVE
jgi:hypothetical protein